MGLGELPARIQEQGNKYIEHERCDDRFANRPESIKVFLRQDYDVSHNY